MHYKVVVTAEAEEDLNRFIQYLNICFLQSKINMQQKMFLMILRKLLKN